MLRKAVLRTHGSFSVSSWLSKNVPWAWSSSSSRDKGPSQPVLDLPTWRGAARGARGNVFPVSDLLSTPLFCGIVCVVWHLSNLTTISVPCGKGTWPLQRKRGCRPSCSVLAAEWDLQAVEDCCARWSRSCSVSSLHQKSIIYLVLDCILFSLAMPIPRCMGKSA